MPLNSILNEDWSEYDNRKIRDKRDGKFFACTESWEKDYLKRKIRNRFPSFSEINISNAIEQCCKTIGSPHPRRVFVECVLKRLGII